MIPKTIHYCWFGRNPLPELAQRCIASWRKYLPDYEIIEWNEDNFDVNIIPYTSEAYALKKYAFVSDYARFWILYHFGGLYFDTDVEVIAPMDHIISQGAFMGQEFPEKSIYDYLRFGAAAGLGIGAEQYHPFYNKVLERYKHLHFVSWKGRKDQTTVVITVTQLLLQKPYERVGNDIFKIDGITIYPPEYFCPMYWRTGELLFMTDNTVSIHHYKASWKEKNPEKKFIGRIIERLYCASIWLRSVIKYYFKQYVAKRKQRTDY